MVRALRDEYVATYGLLRAMGLLTVEHLKLGIETYDPDVNFTRVRNGPCGRLRHRRRRSDPRALGAQVGDAAGRRRRTGRVREGESLAEVLASIRALVSAETEARGPVAGDGETVLMLTPEMRIERAPSAAEDGAGRRPGRAAAAGARSSTRRRSRR